MKASPDAIFNFLAILGTRHSRISVPVFLRICRHPRGLCCENEKHDLRRNGWNIATGWDIVKPFSVS